jgi:hypothetical protein
MFVEAQRLILNKASFAEWMSSSVIVECFMALAECFKHSANVVILVVSAATRRMRVREKRDDDEYDTWVHQQFNT